MDPARFTYLPCFNVTTLFPTGIWIIIMIIALIAKQTPAIAGGATVDSVIHNGNPTVRTGQHSMRRLDPSIISRNARSFTAVEPPIRRSARDEVTADRRLIRVHISAPANSMVPPIAKAIRKKISAPEARTRDAATAVRA